MAEKKQEVSPPREGVHIMWEGYLKMYFRYQFKIYHSIWKKKKTTCLDLVEKNNVWAMLDIHEWFYLF